MSLILIEEFVKEALLQLQLEKRKRARRKKPGGPRTDMGAWRQLNPEKFRNVVRSTMNSEQGNVSDAAGDLGVSTRTLYHYLEDEPLLRSVKTSTEREHEEEEKKRGT